MLDVKRVLVLAPHTDDGEFGCGGTLAKLLEEGKEVFYVAFSTCERSVPEGFPKNILEIEVQEATRTLGIPALNVFILSFDVRHFPQHRQEILEELIRIRSQVNPDLVFLPSLKDIHQDHYTVAIEGVRAFKKVSILGYEVPWNNLSIENQVFSALEERHIQVKLSALACYQSQGFRAYASEEFIRSLATVRGVQGGVKLAETFEVIRWFF